MESIAILSQRYRVDIRYRRWAQNNQPGNQQTEQTNENRGQTGSQDKSSTPPQKERERRRSAMTRDHRLYHRRQAGAATEVLTVSVDIIATVDTSGNIVGQETRTQGESAAPTVGIAAVDTPTPGVVPGVIPGVVPGFVPGVVPSAVNVVDSVAAPGVSAVKNVADLTPPAVPVPAVPSLPQVPAVPAVPTVALPVVPAVPPFPTDLTVPAYPFATGASAVVAQVSSNAAPSPAPTSVAASSAVIASASAALNSSARSSAPSSASAVSGRSASTSASASDSASAASPTSSSDSDDTASFRNPSATSNPSPNRTTYYNGPGGVVPVNTADPAQTTAAVGSSNSGPTTPLQTPQVVGSVVGSLAGAALILAIILFLLKRHKRQRRGALQLTNDDVSERAAPPMSQDPLRNNRIPSAFLNRFSGMSKSTIETNASSGERSFQRVSGRKLPSAFSEGMTSDQFSRGGTLSGSSFYQDDQGTYGGPGMSKEFGKEVGVSSVAPGAAAMNIRPGPGRTPVIRHPDDEYANPFADPAPFPKHQSHLSPPQSPNPDVPRGTLGRSLYSHDGSRSSKFTENV